MLVWAPRVLLPDHDDFVAGWVEIDQGRITATGVGQAPRQPDEVIAGTLVPGFVDAHAHGGGGASFVTDDPADVETVLAAHRAFGTTSMIASLVTGSIAALEAQVRLLADKVHGGDLAGIHLEGPWLAMAYKGAHAPSLLADPLAEDVLRLVEAGAGTVRMVTIAPELDGAIEAIGVLATRGCVPAIGHTAASYEDVRRAIAAGATGATHLFNAMPPLRHRDPGPVLALWEDPRVTLELVLDGIHVRPELAAFVFRTAPGRVVLVSDAMAATGAPDGDYLLGDLPVQVRDRVARLADTGTIAGSTLTLDRAVRNAVAAGIPLAEAVLSVSTRPAAYLGLAGIGSLAAGNRADLVVLDEALEVARVMYRGGWINE